MISIVLNISLSKMFSTSNFLKESTYPHLVLVCVECKNNISSPQRTFMTELMSEPNKVQQSRKSNKFSLTLDHYFPIDGGTTLIKR